MFRFDRDGPRIRNRYTCRPDRTPAIAASQPSWRLGQASLTAHLRGGLCGSLRHDVVLCVMLEPRYGSPGAAAATSISLAFETVLLFWIVRKRLGLHVLAFGKR